MFSRLCGRASLLGAEERSEPVSKQFASFGLVRLSSNKEASRELHLTLAAEQRPKVVPRDAAAVVNVQGDRSPLSSISLPSPSFQRLESARPKSLEGLQWTASRIALERCIEAERCISGTSGTDFFSHQQRLLARLDRLGLDMLEAEADGNCQFRSLSQQLYNSQAHHSGLRQLAVHHMRMHPADFQDFLGEELDSYLENMALDGTWGDELTLRALCDALGIVINLVTSDKRNWYHKYRPQAITQPDTEVFLTYLAPIHYNPIKRRAASNSMTRAWSAPIPGLLGSGSSSRSAASTPMCRVGSVADNTPGGGTSSGGGGLIRVAYDGGHGDDGNSII